MLGDCRYDEPLNSCHSEDVFMMATDFRRQTSSLPFSVGCALLPRVKVRYIPVAVPETAEQR